MNKKANYVIIKKSKNKFYFELESPNGEFLGESKIYESKHKAYMNVASVRANVMLLNLKFITRIGGYHSFTVLNSKKEAILISKDYNTIDERNIAHAAVIKYAPGANITERIYK